MSKKLRFLLTCLVLSGLIGLLSGPDVLARLYMWKDKDGVTHIVTRPKPGELPSRPGPRAKTAKPSGPGKVFLWKCEGAPVYLLGSIHIGVKDLYPLHPLIEEAYAESRAVAVEIDMDSPQNQARGKSLFLKLGSYPKGDSLDKHISQKTRNKLKGVMLPMFLVKNLRPWALAVTLETMRQKAAGFDEKLGIDLHYLTRAKKDGKEVLELERIEDQVRIFADFPPEMEEAFLYQTLDNLASIPEQTEEIFALWRRGDADGLAELLFKDLQEHPEETEIYESLFFRRNHGMAEKVESYIKQGKAVLVIVGSGHLVGPRSVVDLLRRKGYVVNQQG